MRERLQQWVESSVFQNAIIAIIVLNAITIGLETEPGVVAATGTLLFRLDRIFLAIFVVELLAKLFVYRGKFWSNGWNVFDFIIVGIALVPASGPFSVLRALRILRAFRLLSQVPSMRRVVTALASAIPGMGSIVLVLMVVFYVSSVMATKLFGPSFPQFFGGVGDSMFSLFQIMTLESWSSGIVRPVLDVYPYAWVFFVPFIVITSFAVLNLFIGVIVDSMQRLHILSSPDDDEITVQKNILDKLQAVERELTEVKSLLDRKGRS